MKTDRTAIMITGTLPLEYLQEFLQAIRNVESKDANHQKDINLMIRLEALNAAPPELKAILESIAPPFASGVHVFDEPFHCEECGGTNFLEGPRGGLCTNFACADCLARYNDAIIRIDRSGYVSAAERDLYFKKTEWFPVDRNRKQHDHK